MDVRSFVLSETVLWIQSVFYGSIKILECGCGDATWGLTAIAKFEMVGQHANV